MILLLNQQIEDLANEQTAVWVLVMVFGIVIMDEFEQIPVFAGVFPFRRYRMRSCWRSLLLAMLSAEGGLKLRDFLSHSE